MNGLSGLFLYCTLFAAVWTWCLVMILERRDSKYRQSGTSFADAFPAAGGAGVFVFISNVLVMLFRQSGALYYDIALVTALAGFGLYRETGYRSRARSSSRGLKAEVRLLEIQIKKDPLNAAYFARLSELLEKLGEKGKALEAARRTAELEPTVKNFWRVKHLEDN